MNDRTCIKCETVFKFPSYYKRHLQTSARCKIIIEDINNEISIIIPIVNINNLEPIENLDSLTNSSIINQEPVILTETR